MEPKASVAAICSVGVGLLVNAPSAGTEICGLPGAVVFTEKVVVVGVPCGLPAASDWVTSTVKSPSTNLPPLIAVPLQPVHDQAPPVGMVIVLGVTQFAENDVVPSREVPVTVTPMVPPASFTPHAVVQPTAGGFVTAPTRLGDATTFAAPGATVSTTKPTVLDDLGELSAASSVTVIERVGAPEARSMAPKVNPQFHAPAPLHVTEQVFDTGAGSDAVTVWPEAHAPLTDAVLVARLKIVAAGKPARVGCTPLTTIVC